MRKESGGRRVGKIAWRYGRNCATSVSDFAHAVDPGDRTAWATRPPGVPQYARSRRGRVAHPTRSWRAATASRVSIATCDHNRLEHGHDGYRVARTHDRNA